MFYMASQIVFFLLLATIVGAGIGWGLASASKVSVFKALSRSGADAPRERELASAKSQIEELSRQLSIAKEAIREIETRDAMVAAAAAVNAEHGGEEAPADSEEAPADGLEANGQGELADAEDSVEASAEEAAEDVASEEAGEDADAAEAVDTTSTSPRRMSRDKGGRRLSERVADATVGAPESTD